MLLHAKLAKNYRDPVLKFTTLACLLSICVACGTVQTPPDSEISNADQRSLIQKFEQQIADKLLNEIPAWQSFKTRQDAIDFVAAVRKVTGSGLNTQMLSSSQQRTLLRLEKLVPTAEFELNQWQYLNHLSDTQLLNMGDMHDKTLNVVVDNLKYQLAAQDASIGPSHATTSYPAPLLEYARRTIRESSTTPDSTATLSALVEQLKGNHGSWLENRLGLVFSLTEHRAILARLLELQDEHAQREEDFLIEHSVSANDYYQNPYYDLMLEQGPKQLALDLIAINLEEGLEQFNYSEPVSFTGLQTPMASFSYMKDDGVNLSLTELLKYPGFELQPIAYRIAGEIIARNTWPTAWHQPLGRAIGFWFHQQSFAQSSLESTLGYLTRKKVLLILAVAELQIQQGDITLTDVRRQLLINTPYSVPQVDGILLDWFASKSSFALTALLTDDLLESKSDEIERLLNTEMPRSYPELKSRLARD